MDDIKETLDILYGICDTIDEKVGDNNEKRTREMLKREIVDFLIFLATADAKITKEEIEIINKVDSDVTMQTIKSYIPRRDLQLEIYSKKVPPIINIMVLADKMFKSLNPEISAITPQIIGFFEHVGKELIGADGIFDEKERDRLGSYLTLCKKFTEEELKEYDVSVNISKYSWDSIKDTLKNDIADEVDEMSDVIENIKIQNDQKEDDEDDDLGSGLDSDEELDEDEDIACQEDDDETFESLMNELNNLIGLNGVKEDVSSLINFVQVEEMRRKRGIKSSPVSLHMVFYGNPGTGKTTIARLLAKLYKQIGVLSKGHMVEVDRSGLVGGYLGQTAIKTKKVIKKALGGVLFIDEAYSLNGGYGDQYGQEAVDTLLKMMEDNRNNLIVIVAGYPELMNKFIEMNPGLKSRFNKYFSFEDYSSDELLEIFKVMCKNDGFTYTQECIEYIKWYLVYKHDHKDENFANAREVRNLYESMKIMQANRLVKLSNVDNSQLTRFTIDDINAVCKK